MFVNDWDNLKKDEGCGGGGAAAVPPLSSCIRGGVRAAAAEPDSRSLDSAGALS